MKKVIVVGAGASGLCAAIAAAREGASVSILERETKPGRKLLLTGNGRCNLTNMDPLLAGKYYSNERGVLSRLTDLVFAENNPVGIRQFFYDIGLPTREKDGYVYPVTGQASSVLHVLVQEAQKSGVTLRCNTCVTSLRYDPLRKLWMVGTGSWQYEADAVILCCGSCVPPGAAETETGSGYELARSLGLCLTDLDPALTGLRCRMSASLKKAAGARTRTGVSLCINGRTTAYDEGEVQWAADGISGIVVFSLSRLAARALRAGEQVMVHLDLLPDVSLGALTSLLSDMTAEPSRGSLSGILKGIIHDRLLPAVMEESGLSAASGGPLTSEEIRHLTRAVKNLPLQITGIRSFSQAQVCAGGISLTEIMPETLESGRLAGLYLAGELLDVDGPCGGYNLQWAWASGLWAGRCAAHEKQEKER